MEQQGADAGGRPASSQQGRQLYELAAAEPGRIFSPYCWRIRMALAHKGLSFESIPWRFVDKAAIAFSGQERVPVLVDRGRTIVDSWAIADYLDDTYPVGPPLFGSAEAKGVCRLVAHWVEAVLHPALVRVILLDIYEHLDSGDRSYFRSSREKMLGGTLEDIVAEPEAKLAAFRRALEPARRTLASQAFLAGPEPAFADFILFAIFQWARAVSRVHLLADGDPLAAWRHKLLSAFDGMPAAAPGYPV